MLRTSTGDNISTYDWYVDGDLVKTGLGNSLDGLQYFVRNQQVYVAITPNDGLEDGQALISDVIDVVNTPPEILSAMIIPELFPKPTLWSAPQKIR